jgi:hypothetical protein
LLRRGFALLPLALAIVVMVGTAHGATSTKFYDASVRLKPATTSTYTLTLTNDSSSTQTLGSANFTAPPGWTASSVEVTPVTSTDGHAWNISTTTINGSSVVQFRAASNGDAIARGKAVSASVAVTISSCSSATWVTETKQSNDFSGQPGNGFQPVVLDLTPLGSFAIAQIGTQITGTQFPVGVTAKDTCGNAKTDYTGVATVSSTLSGATFVPAPGLTWSAGVGALQITPTVSEAHRTLTVTDSTTGITRTSNAFSIFDVLCTSSFAACHNANTTTTVDTPSPPSNGAMGLGFNASLQFHCGALASPVGSFANIDPVGYAGPISITFTYTKAVSSRQVSSFVTCISKDDGATWSGPLGACSKTIPAPPCISSRSRTNHGDLQIVLLLSPDDPWVGTA